MQHTTKVGIKKKIDLIEPKPTKSRVVMEKKPLKNEIIAQFKALQTEYDALKHENAKNVNVIKSLEEKVVRLQKTSLLVSSRGSQTFSSDIQIFCNICIYVATCEEELNWHMEYAHDLSSDSYFDKEFYCEICSRWFSEESDLGNHMQDHQKVKVVEESSKFYCNFCEETFTNKKCLMKHKKRNHKERVTLCWKYESGICDFDDSSCWFIHCLNRKEDQKMLKCRSCEKEFKTLSDCLKHKKQEHPNLVSFCKNETEGICKFGKERCWFKHNETKGIKPCEISENQMKSKTV